MKRTITAAALLAALAVTGGASAASAKGSSWSGADPDSRLRTAAVATIDGASLDRPRKADPVVSTDGASLDRPRSAGTDSATTDSLIRDRR